MLFCGEEEENIELILIHCPKIRLLWSLLVALGIMWVTPLLVKDLIICQNKIPIRKNERKISRTTLCCLFCAIWKEMNKVIFENEEFSLSRLKSFFVYTLYSWASLVVCSDSMIIKKP